MLSARNMEALVSHNASLSFSLFSLYCAVYLPWQFALRIMYDFLQ